MKPISATIFLLFVLLILLTPIYSQDYERENDFWVQPLHMENSGAITAYLGFSETIRIPPIIRGMTITEIWESSFENRELSEIEIPDSVERINYRAFAWNQIISLSLPTMLNFIGEGAFARNRITEIIFSGNLQLIGNYAFRRNRIVSLVLPDSLTHIGIAAFEDNRLENLVLSESLTSIEDFTFLDNLLEFIVIPDNIRYIGSAAFLGNPISRITIGSNVEISNNEFLPALPPGFINVYNEEGRRAGTYFLENEIWNVEFRQ